MKMKMTKLLSTLLAVFAGIVLFVPSSALAAAFGVSPPWIENDNLRAGSNFVYVINLSANDLPEDMTVKSELIGDPEIMQWVTVQNTDSIVMTKGKSSTPLSVNVNVPDNANIGNYKGSLTLSLSTKTKAANTVAVMLGGNISIDLDVIDYDVTSFKLRSASVDPIKEGQPVALGVVVDNRGNTKVTNITTKASIVDIKTDKVVMSSSVDKLSVAIQPQTSTEAKMLIPAQDLEAGKYWLNVEFFEGRKSIYESRLHLVVEPTKSSNAVGTDVRVVEKAEMRFAAPTEMEKQVKLAAPTASQPDPGTTVRTSVTVRAPYTDKLIVVIIGLLIVLVGVTAKMYLHLKKRRR